MSLRFSEEEYAEWVKRREGTEGTTSPAPAGHPPLKGRALEDAGKPRREAGGEETTSPGASRHPILKERALRMAEAEGLDQLSEESEQMLLIRWAEWSLGKYPELALLFHIPNGGWRSAAEAGRFKAMGVKKGVPDLFLPSPRGGFHGLFIEMKRRVGGCLSPEQGEWLEALRAVGYRALRCDGWEQARDALVEYLEMEN